MITVIRSTTEQKPVTPPVDQQEYYTLAGLSLLKCSTPVGPAAASRYGKILYEYNR